MYFLRAMRGSAEPGLRTLPRQDLGMLIELSAQHCGPPQSGNGGYVCGLCAHRYAMHVSAYADSGALRGPFAFEAKYSQPAPIGAPAILAATDSGSELKSADGAVLFAGGRPAAGEFAAPPAVAAYDQAERAAARYLSADEHLFPDCFVCGPNRKAGDGLRIFAAPFSETDATVAAAWKLDAAFASAQGVIPLPIVWSALDCPGYFAYLFASGDRKTPTVLARMRATVFSNRVSSPELVVMGWIQRRKAPFIEAGTALYEGARLLAQAECVWMQPRNWSDANRGARQPAN
jgi:hypothetical protein